MVIIRLYRKGKKKKPFYNLVVIDKRKARNGKFIEKVGTYNPLSKELKIKIEKIKYWKEKGAKESRTVRFLIKNLVNDKN